MSELEAIWRWLRSKQTVRHSLTIFGVSYLPARLATVFEIKAVTESNVVTDIIVGPLFLVIAVLLFHLFFVMWTTWWKNRAPTFLEAIFWLVIIVMPEGYFVYYYFVYRHLDEYGQHAVGHRSSNHTGAA
jgi:hypothetical protein